MEQTLFPSPQAASFVAIGDSFTEGLNDPAPVGGGFLGWADRLAGMLAAGYPGLRYANLAVRGKLLRQIVHDQLPAAVALSPGLVSIAGGGNDILRPGADPDTLAELFDTAVARLTQAGSRVLMFTGFDPVGFPILRLLRGGSRRTTCTCVPSPTPAAATWWTCGRCGSCASPPRGARTGCT